MQEIEKIAENDIIDHWIQLDSMAGDLFHVNMQNNRKIKNIYHCNQLQNVKLTFATSKQ